MTMMRQYQKENQFHTTICQVRWYMYYLMCKLEENTVELEYKQHSKWKSKFSYFLSKLPIYGHFKTLYLMIETSYRLSDTLLIKTNGKIVLWGGERKPIGWIIGQKRSWLLDLYMYSLVGFYIELHGYYWGILRNISSSPMAVQWQSGDES